MVNHAQLIASSQRTRPDRVPIISTAVRVAKILIVLLLMALAQPAFSQEVTQEGAGGIAYGTQVVGELNDVNPFAEYVFAGLRGDVVTVTLEVTGGDLDPLLTLVDTQGNLLATRDDTSSGTPAGARGIRLESLHLPVSGAYRILVGRFGYGLGSTDGNFRLTLERVGASSASGSAMRYGDSLINTITDTQPQLYYSFRARRGDIVAVQMHRVSGDLDPVLQIVNQRSLIIAENDDVPGSGSQDAQISGLIIEEDGTYVIIASRYGQGAGRSTGSFVLTLQATDTSGLGSTVLAAIDIELGQTITGEITNERHEQFYRFFGRQNDTITISMTRAGGDSLDPLLVLTNTALQEITSNDDSFGTQNATIENFTLPADGAYYIIATRYQRAGGTTTGSFTLDLESAGSPESFTGVPAAAAQLTYGSSVSGVINDASPQTVYSFQGNAGDTVSVIMTRMDGNLDSHLSILDSQLRELVSDDDSGGDQNARIDRFTLPETGTYYIQASRFSGQALPTSGGYLLVLTQRFD
jgi:hypothetical protein